MRIRNMIVAYNIRNVMSLDAVVFINVLTALKAYRNAPVIVFHTDSSN